MQVKNITRVRAARRRAGHSNRRSLWLQPPWR